MAFCYLLLGHLLGDFVLQTNRIAVNKPLYRRWGIVHAVIVTLCMLIFSIPFGLTTTLLVIPAGIFHFLIDKTKSKITDKYKIPELPAFITDQVLHVAIIYFAAGFAWNNESYLFINKYQTGFLIAALLVTFFAAIFNQYILVIFYPRPGNELFWKGEKLFGIIIRFIMFTSLFLSFKYSFLFLLILLLIPVMLKIKLNIYDSYPMGEKESLLKLLLDILVSTMGSALITLI